MQGYRDRLFEERARFVATAFVVVVVMGRVYGEGRANEEVGRLVLSHPR